MREIVILLLSVVVVVSFAMLSIYGLGKSYEQNIYCPKCEQSFGVGKYSVFSDKAVALLVYVPNFLNKKYFAAVNLTTDRDINAAFSYFLAIFSCFLVLAILSGFVFKILSLIFNPPQDTQVQ